MALDVYANTSSLIDDKSILLEICTKALEAGSHSRSWTDIAKLDDTTVELYIRDSLIFQLVGGVKTKHLLPTNLIEQAITQYQMAKGSDVTARIFNSLLNLAGSQ